MAEVAVIGVEDRDLGEEVGAAYRYPRHVRLLDELPKGPTGKILRREVEPPQELTADR